MGLKTTNYKVEKLNLVLPEAYAYIIDCYSDRKNGYAMIGIFANREDAENINIQPYEVKRINFLVDRAENDRITAYNKAKSQSYVPYFNIETKEIDYRWEDEYFVGWEDDIRE